MERKLESLVDHVAGEVLVALRGNGLAELKDKRWEDLEGPAVVLGDAVTRKVLEKLLGEQAEAFQKCAERNCGCCEKVLDDEASETRGLVTPRGIVRWKTPVQHCAACRRDFFPSSEGLGD